MIQLQRLMAKDIFHNAVKQALAVPSDEEKMLWIGHPWLMVSAVDSQHLRLRETTEYGEPTDLIEVQVETKKLEQAIQVAEIVLIEFGQRLHPILEEIFPKEHKKALEILILRRY